MSYKVAVVGATGNVGREILSKRVPGAVVAIARDGKLVHYKAYGQLDAAKGTAMPLDAVFALASMTKPMAAVAGLTLMEQGRLPLQAKLSDYYAGFADMKVGVPQADSDHAPARFASTREVVEVQGLVGPMEATDSDVHDGGRQCGTVVGGHGHPRRTGQITAPG